MPIAERIVTGTCQYFRDGNSIVATCRLKMKRGDYVTFEARVPIAPIFRELTQAIRAGVVEPEEFMPQGGFEVGFGWSDIVEGVKSVASKIAKNRATETIKKIVDNPKIAAGIGIASTIFPPLGATYGAVAAGSKLLDKLSGELSAKAPGPAVAKVKKIVTAANVQNPLAQHARLLLANLWKIKKHEPSPGVPYPYPGCPPVTRVAPTMFGPPYLPPRRLPLRYAMPYGYRPRRRRRRRRRRGLWRRGLPGGGFGVGVHRPSHVGRLPGGGFGVGVHRPSHVGRHRVSGRRLRNYRPAHARAQLRTEPFRRATRDPLDVAGWLWNVPYRGVIQAAIQPSPGMVVRSLYGKGLRWRRP